MNPRHPRWNGPVLRSLPYPPVVYSNHQDDSEVIEDQDDDQSEAVDNEDDDTSELDENGVEDENSP